MNLIGLYIYGEFIVKSKSSKSMSNQEIKEVLPYGAIKEISARAKVHHNTVTRVLNGRSDNLKVKNAIAGYLSRKKRIEQRIESAIS